MIQADKHDGYYFYFHIPFCNKKCSYCFYNSSVPTSKGLVDKYLRYLEKEIKARVKNKRKYVADVVYIGGGTPNYLSNKQLESLLLIIKQNIDLSNTKEFTMEINPASCTLNQLKMLKKYGVTRLSFGIQTLDTKILKAINRYYVKDPSVIILAAKKMGFIVNTDFMFGLPNQKVSDADSMVEFIKKVQPNLCSFHELRIGTEKMDIANKNSLIPYDKTHKFYERFVNGLRKIGFSQFAPELFSCQKKIALCNYGNNWWARGKIIGFGISAFSQIGNKFMLNKDKAKGYYKDLDNGTVTAKFNYTFRAKELAILNFVSAISAGVAVDVREIKKIYNISIPSILCEEIKEALNKKIILFEKGFFFLNPDKFTFSTPSIPFFLKKFRYLEKIWDIAGGSSGKMI